MSETAREHVRRQLVRAAHEAADRLDVDYTGSIVFHFDDGRFQRYQVVGTYRLGEAQAAPSVEWRPSGTDG